MSCPWLDLFFLCQESMTTKLYGIVYQVDRRNWNSIETIYSRVFCYCCCCSVLFFCLFDCYVLCWTDYLRRQEINGYCIKLSEAECLLFHFNKLLQVTSNFLIKHTHFCSCCCLRQSINYATLTSLDISL